MSTRPVPAHLLDPSLPVPTPESWCEQYQKAKGKGQTNPTSLSAVTSSASSIHQHALKLTLVVLNVATPTPHPSAWPAARNAITVAATIITLSSAEAVDPPDHPLEELDCPEAKLDCPTTMEEDTTGQAAGTDFAMFLAGIPATSPAKGLPTALLTTPCPHHSNRLPR